MTKIEKHFRSIGLSERARQLEEETLALGERLPAGAGELLDARLHLATIYLAKAAGELADYAANSMDLETMLRLSIATVQERKECERIGEEPSATLRPDVTPAGPQTIKPFRNGKSPTV